MPANVEQMAYSGETPWHGLGNKLGDGHTIDQWRVEAGLDWQAEAVPVTFETKDGEYYEMDDRQVIYRDDTDLPLGIVSDKYKIVQPGEVLEFFRDITDLGQFKMETAGSLDEGRKLWALARAQRDGKLGPNEEIRPYLFMATSLDGKMSTHASFTTVRVVCQNTLDMAISGTKGSSIKVNHRGSYNERKVKQQLGLVDDSFDAFMATADTLANKKVSKAQTDMFLGTLFGGTEFLEANEKDQGIMLTSKNIETARHTMQTFAGQDTAAANGTAWGLVNGVTAYLDHIRNTRSQDARMEYVWFGRGKTMKQEAVGIALKV